MREKLALPTPALPVLVATGLERGNMDARRFDSLARKLAAPRSRRNMVRSSVALVSGAIFVLRRQSAAALTCASGEFVCGQGSNAVQKCCPFPNACCHATGQCCAANQFCQRGSGSETCRDNCPINEHPCGGDGACCPYFDGTCCGADGRTCCRAPDICDSKTSSGVSNCATPCDIFSRRCARTGACCPYDQKCCGATCCYPGHVCYQNTKCARPSKRRKRRRRHHH